MTFAIANACCSTLAKSSLTSNGSVLRWALTRWISEFLRQLLNVTSNAVSSLPTIAWISASGSLVATLTSYVDPIVWPVKPCTVTGLEHDANAIIATPSSQNVRSFCITRNASG